MHSKELVKLAREGMQHAYVPYSGFKVGAAVLASSGKVYTGCNVENASYGLTVCAERVAIFQAISAGEKNLEAIAVISSGKERITPCGACRQVMAEFNPNLQLILADGQGEYQEYTLQELLPEMFSLDKEDGKHADKKEKIVKKNL